MTEIESVSWPELPDGDFDIATEDDVDMTELALRNVHPKHFVDGRLTSQIFTPSDDDEGMRSTARGGRVKPENHLAEYRALGLESCGVCSVTHKDIRDVNLRWVDDSQNNTSITAHASIDFRIEDGRVPGRRKLKQLAQSMVRRASWQVEPGSGAESSDA